MCSLFYVWEMVGFVAALSEISINRQARNWAFSLSQFPNWTARICPDKPATEANKDFIMKDPSPALRMNPSLKPSHKNSLHNPHCSLGALEKDGKRVNNDARPGKMCIHADEQPGRTHD